MFKSLTDLKASSMSGVLYMFRISSLVHVLRETLALQALSSTLLVCAGAPAVAPRAGKTDATFSSMTVLNERTGFCAHWRSANLAALLVTAILYVCERLE